MDRSFGVLLMAGALLTLWLYDSGRLPAVWAIIQQGPGARPGMPTDQQRAAASTPGAGAITLPGATSNPLPPGSAGSGPHLYAPPGLG